MELADCYRLLGLRSGASYEDIKASYRRLARRYHPDANPENKQQAEEKFIQVTDAYRLLISAVEPAVVQKEPNPELPNDGKPAAKPEPKPPRVDWSRLRPQSQSPQPARSSQTAAKATTSPAAEVDPVQRDRDLKQNSYEQLQLFLREQRFPRAIALVEGLAHRLPNDVEVRQWQAITYQRFGRHLIATNQPEKARLYLQKALRTDPHNRSLWYEVERDFQRIDQTELF